MDFTAEQIATGVNYVIERGARRSGQTVTYSDVFEAAGLPNPEEFSEGERSRYMEHFHEHHQNNELPPLDALVVRKSGDRRGVPGTGYFRVNQFYRRVRQEPDWEDRMRRRFIGDLCADDGDTAFYVGNQFQAPRGFLVLGVWWPPKQEASQPSLLDL